MKRIVWLLVLSVVFAPFGAARADEPSPVFAFSQRFIDSVHQLYQGAALDKEILAVFEEFHKRNDLGRNIEFQARIQGLADRQKDFYARALEKVQAPEGNDAAQKVVSTRASKATTGLLAKNRMFSDVLQGHEDHSRGDYNKTEGDAWGQLLIAADNFPSLVSLRADGGKRGTPIPYKISKEQRDSLLRLLDTYFGPDKAAMIAAVKAHNRDRSKPALPIQHVILKIYDSLQFDTYEDYTSKAVTRSLIDLM